MLDYFVFTFFFLSAAHMKWDQRKKNYPSSILLNINSEGLAKLNIFADLTCMFNLCLWKICFLGDNLLYQPDFIEMHRDICQLPRLCYSCVAL